MTFRFATRDLSKNNAKSLIAAIRAQDTNTVKRSIILYGVLGKSTPWPNDPQPFSPPDNEQCIYYRIFRDAIGAKRIYPEDVSLVVPRYNWTSGTVYTMYRDTQSNLCDEVYYVITDEMNVYKCLYNNKNAPSTIKPTGFSTTRFTTSDGYTWKYMYTISLGESSKFMTTSFMPVKKIQIGDGSTESDRQLAVQNAAVNGSIEIIEVNNTGSRYAQVANGVVEAAGVRTLKLSVATSDPPSPIDNFYNGSTVYVISGTGAGQIRRIIDYAGSTKTLTVNTAFATVCNTDSRVIISPTVTIIGDGRAAKAYASVNPSTGGIANISMIDTGSEYTRAVALITANSIHGSGATANVIISPVGGHGSDPTRELPSNRVMLNVQFNSIEGISANGNGYIPSNTEFRTISILKDPVLKVDVNNNKITVEKVANTSNSPQSLRLTTRLKISYLQMIGANPVNAFQIGDILTNERNRLRAELGTLEFVTELNEIARRNASLQNAVQGANGQIVYIRDDETEADPSFFVAYLNNVQSYSDYIPFTKDDVLLKSTDETKVAVVEDIKGPEANTFSGEILYTENVSPVTRTIGQTEDVKIILEF
jgi:hypothetical protein